MNLALLLFVFGVSLFGLGIWLIYPPAAMMFAGIVLLALAAMFGVTKKAPNVR